MREVGRRTKILEDLPLVFLKRRRKAQLQMVLPSGVLQLHPARRLFRVYLLAH